MIAAGLPEAHVAELLDGVRGSFKTAQGCRDSFLHPLFDRLEAAGLVGEDVVELRHQLRDA